MTIAMPETQTVPIEDIKPYWRNPRRIPAEAVEAVATSIKEYGYQQPIVVDKDMVVIVGHTRLQALKKLGVAEIPVYVSDLPEAKAKEYRLIDNRTGEMTTWDHSALVLELREFETHLLESFFPDIDLEIGQVNDAVHNITDEDVSKAEESIRKVKEAETILTTEVVCPSCFHSFKVRTDSLPGLSRNDLSEMKAGGEAV
jgi:site-specific DNA-methyltransferase (adenine-specific)